MLLKMGEFESREAAVGFLKLIQTRGILRPAYCFFSHMPSSLSIMDVLILTNFLNNAATEVPHLGSRACDQRNEPNSQICARQLYPTRSVGSSKLRCTPPKAVVAWIEEKWFLACSFMQVQHGRLSGQRTNGVLYAFCCPQCLPWRGLTTEHACTL